MVVFVPDDELMVYLTGIPFSITTVCVSENRSYVKVPFGDSTELAKRSHTFESSGKYLLGLRYLSEHLQDVPA